MTAAFVIGTLVGWLIILLTVVGWVIMGGEPENLPSYNNISKCYYYYMLH